ncbi:hypothetical protein SAMN05421672_102128 [Pseudomonas flexibilis]|jgi:hypothetical protein|uniref:Uncharacterized protein n=1 Tax=Pseudomonas flexibilis TaxID=706570 RepID=A0A1N6PEN7_9PSED|nr:hypothetical protein SAMN05421672_102128 [Pseudomonas flexibilis]
MHRSSLTRAMHWLRAYLDSDQLFFIYLAESQRHAG